ncbi:bifunctional 2-polyprenyl-6-hydroxyphenol methylase/3-demethylubiquinol 3-O-methyltransferase UbiG [Brachyspira innocens]|uniref:class I SAM-dependent methyltransferase n=1 Tax=Brachyspira innocens TaxID=13264 RepID=UPI0026F23D8E|nr:methyltransferase domain-containing protein [Brachyspira innocens]
MHNICIITDIGTIYGFGHITRMKFIANRLKEYYNFVFSSINNNSDLFKDKSIQSCKYNEIKSLKPYLIIVDSREVEVKFIKELKTISNVIIIDSVGNERAFADIVIEMLPNIDNSKEVNIKPFITTILNSNIKPKYDENAPVLLYLGFNNDLKKKAIDIISKIEDKNFVLIEKEEESGYINIKYKDFSPDIFVSPYSAVITYFGLTAFECIEASIPTVLLSPTKYHDDLARNKDELFFNLGFFENVNTDEAVLKLKDFLFNKDTQNKYLENGKSINTEKSLERIKTIIDNIKDFKDIKCPFCGSSHIEMKNRNIESNLYSCLKCHTLFRKYFLPPFTDYSSKYFVEDYKNQYGKTYEEDSKNLTALAKRRLEKIKKLKPSGKVLDIGSAMGFFLNEAREYGYETEGIEISEYASSYCRDTLKLNVHNCSLLDFEYKEKEYDIITAWYVIEHIYNFENILERIIYSLKDDGILAFATPNGYGLSGRFNKNYFSIVPSDHAFEANPKSLDILLSKYSLKCINLENQSLYYNRFCDIFNLKFISKNKLLSKIYNVSAKKKNLGDTFECIYKKF